MNKILIVTTFYPPCERIGGKRPYNIANYLANNGWDVTVLTLLEQYTPPIGEKIVQTNGIKLVRTKAFLPYVSLTNRSIRTSNRNISSVNANTASSVSNIKRLTINYIKGFIRNTLNSFDYIDEYSGWYGAAIKEMRKHNSQFDIVLATIPPYSTGYLGMRLAEIYNSKFIIDYRDPWTDLADTEFLYKKYGKNRFYEHKKIEQRYLDGASLVTTVSPGISALLERHCSCKIVTLPQGYMNSKLANNNQSSNEDYLLYAGSLAYGRDLSPILAALKFMSKARNKKIKLIYCGEHDGIVMKQAISVGSIDYLGTKGYVKQNDVHKLAKNSLCNLISISPGYEYAYPGKLFDLISAGRPICILADKENEAGKLVDRYKLGVNIMSHDVEIISKAIENVITESYQPVNMTELSTENIYKTLLHEINQLV